MNFQDLIDLLVVGLPETAFVTETQFYEPNLFP